MISLCDHSRTIGGCIIEHASQHKLDQNQNHDGDDDTSPKDSSTTPSTQSSSSPLSSHGNVLTNCDDFEISMARVEKVVFRGWSGEGC